MVQVEEVIDREASTSGSEYESDSASASGSDYDSDADDLEQILNETLLERIYALHQVIPPTVIRNVKSVVAKTTHNSWATAKIVGNIAWGLTTSAVLVMFPLAFNFERDQSIEQLEREQRKQQQGAQQVCIV
jgi:import receptor subunit TOM22